MGFAMYLGERIAEVYGEELTSIGFPNIRAARLPSVAARASAADLPAFSN